jgi:UDPglucose 6-dehydrogenase
MAMGNALADYPEFDYADSALDAADGADIVLVATAWPEFGEMDPTAVGAIATSTTIVDACQGIDIVAWRNAGWNVHSLTGSTPTDETTPAPRLRTNT